jgi:hypothetical protein
MVNAPWLMLSFKSFNGVARAAGTEETARATKKNGSLHDE